uniref:DUF834 domain-containing protein n=1 Tax=Oryza glumipatula TaxID=40148 RepID=A0A0E0A7Q5_9ORYZ
MPKTEMRHSQCRLSIQSFKALTILDHEHFKPVNSRFRIQSGMIRLGNTSIDQSFWTGRAQTLRHQERRVVVGEELGRRSTRRSSARRRQVNVASGAAFDRVAAAWRRSDGEASGVATRGGASAGGSRAVVVGEGDERVLVPEAPPAPGNEAGPGGGGGGGEAEEDEEEDVVGERAEAVLPSTADHRVVVVATGGGGELHALGGGDLAVADLRARGPGDEHVAVDVDVVHGGGRRRARWRRRVSEREEWRHGRRARSEAVI